MNVEKYLIYKKGTNLIECLGWGGIGLNEESMLVDIEKGLSKAVMFNSIEEAEKSLQQKRDFYNKHKGCCSLYYYDDKTIPEDLGVLKLIFEELQ